MFVSALITFMILFRVSRSNLNFDARQLVRQYGPTICPYTNFCYTNATKILEDTSDKMPCCAPCSCEDNCWDFGNCCPDKDSTNNKDLIQPLLSVCKDPSIKHFSDMRAYQVIDSCPSGLNNVTLLQKCQFANRTSIGDYVWVSDKLTGKIFENKYCALCHGVVDVLPWRILTTCLDLFTLPFSQADGFILSDSCEVINIEPESLSDATKKYACQLPRYSKCNTTGFWKDYVEEFDTACNAFTSIFVQYTYLGRRTFKNMFCYFCNYVEEENVLCPEEFLSMDRNIFKSFHVLLDLGLYTESTNVNTIDGQCGIDEIMDNIMVRTVLFLSL